jgi:pimeloyl-ACP methyl ester carboxylesterase
MSDIDPTNINMIRFDFSGSNKSEGNFHDKTLSKEVQDLACVINYLDAIVPEKPIFIVGHSTGAIIASLYAHLDERIKGLFLLGGVSNLRRGIKYDFDDVRIAEFRMNGFITFNRPDHWLNRKTLSKGYLDDFYRFDPAKSLAGFSGYTCVIHGTEDEIVPAYQDPIDLFQACTSGSDLHLIDNANHQFTDATAWSQVAYIIQNRIIQVIGP